MKQTDKNIYYANFKRHSDNDYRWRIKANLPGFRIHKTDTGTWNWDIVSREGVPQPYGGEILKYKNTELVMHTIEDAVKALETAFNSFKSKFNKPDITFSIVIGEPKKKTGRVYHEEPV